MLSLSNNSIRDVPIFKETYFFRDLKLDIASAIPASNDEK